LFLEGEESPSFPEMSFQNPPIAQTTESTDGYDEQHVTTNLSQGTSCDNIPLHRELPFWNHIALLNLGLLYSNLKP